MTQPADPVKRVLAHAKEFLTGMKRALTARYYAIGLFFYDYIKFGQVKWFVAIKFCEKIAESVDTIDYKLYNYYWNKLKQTCVRLCMIYYIK